MLNRPSKEEMAERQRINDSIALVRQMEWEAQQLSQQISAEVAAASSEQQEGNGQLSEE